MGFKKYKKYIVRLSGGISDLEFHQELYDADDFDSISEKISACVRGMLKKEGFKVGAVAINLEAIEAENVDEKKEHEEVVKQLQKEGVDAKLVEDGEEVDVSDSSKD